MVISPGFESLPRSLRKPASDAGFRVYMPELVGTAGRPVSLPYIAASMARVCVSREFAVLAAHASSPVTDWLRALAAAKSALDPRRILNPGVLID